MTDIVRILVGQEGQSFDIPRRVFLKFEECCYSYLTRDYKLHFDKNGVLIGEGNCTIQVWYNQRNRYKDLDLKVVYGCLGVGAEPNQEAFYEFGDIRCRTFNDLLQLDTMKVDKATGMAKTLDAHVWLEDSEGNVYDVATSLIRAVAIFREREYHYAPNTVLEKVTHQEARKNGLAYFPYPKDLQVVLAAVCKKSFEHEYEDRVDKLVLSQQ